MRRLWFARFEFKPQDCWIGVFWKSDSWDLDVWVCLLPMVPLHFGWKAGIEHHEEVADDDQP